MFSKKNLDECFEMLISNYLSLDYNMCDQTQLALHIPDEVPLTSRQVALSYH